MFVIILSAAICLTSRVLASDCYSDICHKGTELQAPGQQCLYTPIQRGKDCVNLRFENLGFAPAGSESLGKFRLSTYVKDFGKFQGRTTAFNLSISDIAFNRLIARYQDASNYRHADCFEIDIHPKNEETLFPEIFFSCPFAEETFEATPYRLQYLVVGKDFEYSRKLVFVVPRHMEIDESINDVRTFKPFFYIDVSNPGSLLLHIQPLPEEFNVTDYKVWMINNHTNSEVSLELKHNGEEEIRYNFTVVDGVHYFKVAAVHPFCGKEGCVNSTSPAISTKQSARRLVLMIISVVWIPPAILYAMYYAYKLYMKNSLAKQQYRRTNCLLVYSPTHTAHIDVMQKLALYMRSCNINAMIDMLDIPKTANKDPGLWCNSAFRDADVIVIATSPPSGGKVVPHIYRNVDNHALRLLKENYPRRNKRYFVVQFPYCKRDDLPEEARLMRRFEMPGELEKFVRNIYAVDRIRLFGVSGVEFAEAIKVAMVQIPRDCSEKSTLCEEIGPQTEDTLSTVLLPSELPSKMLLEPNKNEKIREKQSGEESYYVINIDELNLLGDKGESETLFYTPPNTTDEFRIDQLNL
ncbi:uncharacterized protein [Venturia canescens]|uniref:uncharacterized protein isoform X2 n=1 Tax=Venturia canescens TaxID=32260 RepID=UPI001C9D04FE|nr:uncharacterized protein LOC122410426 isoform X2 [Venturia canescens]